MVEYGKGLHAWGGDMENELWVPEYQLDCFCILYI